MEVLDISLKRPAILPPTIITEMVFQMMKALKCLRVMKDVEIGCLRTDTLPITIAEKQLMFMG